MVKITQTEEVIEIHIPLNRILSSTKPDVILFKNFIKFNYPPIYFEGFLTNEIVEDESICKIYNKEARITLKKRNFGIWPSILENITKQDALQRKKEIDELLRLQIQEKQKECHKRKDELRKKEIEKVIERDSKTREEIIAIEKDACIKELNHVKDECSEINEENIHHKSEEKFIQSPPQVGDIRKSGKIYFKFSNFNLRTPKRESQNIPNKNE